VNIVDNEKCMAFTFVVDSMVRGYHEYITSSVPILGEELSCMREIGNPHDLIAVAIQEKLVVQS